ncbi:MAG: hypothetical protein H6R10_728 [Rhodocyclaceae bacterium]|nr:hypothetical protein [Rhodocyclaceae bacterium]
MKQDPKTLREKILDWFERNLGAKARSGPLAKALKADPTQVAAALGQMAEAGGDLIRCRVTVSDAERNGGKKEQWEYALATGKAPAAVKPWHPPMAARRDSSSGIPSHSGAATTQAGSGANNPGSQPSETSLATSMAEGLAEAPGAEQSAPAADDKVCCGAAKVMATTAGQEVTALREEIERLQAELAQERNFSEMASAMGRKTISNLEQESARLREDLANTQAAFRMMSAALDKATASVSGFVLRVPKRKPRFLSEKPSALKATNDAAKNAGRADLFALVKIGRAVAKRTKIVEFNEAA